jgi:hypothetical protein
VLVLRLVPLQMHQVLLLKRLSEQALLLMLLPKRVLLPRLEPAADSPEQSGQRCIPSR